MSFVEADTKSDRSDSTTLSEFVKARFNGDIPLLGGSPVTGIRELGAATRGSVTQVNAKYLTLASNMMELMRDMAAQNAPYAFRQPPSSSAIGSPIQMSDNDFGALHAAAELDDDKLSHILSASNVKTEDIRAYMTLLRVARDGTKRKANAMSVHAMQKQAKMSFTPRVAGSELERDLDANRQRLNDIMKLCQFSIDSEGELDLLQAVTHDSFYQGRECNRVLAYIGDAAAKLYAAVEMRRLGRAVADISNLVTTAQSNESFRDKGIKIGLAEHLRVAMGVDPTTRNVMATCYEAIIGVVYLHLGAEGLHTVNAVMQFYPANVGD